MSISLLVGAEAFWDALVQDIGKAGKKILLQTMSFEGDSVGKQLANVLLQSSAPDKRICIDSYSRFVINDSLLFPFALWNKALRKEALETKRLLGFMADNDIGVKTTNPLGPFGVYYPARNHKKLAVIDDKICYLGGINFCEHNFRWMDMMLRVEDPTMASFLSNDFECSWNQQNQSVSSSFQESELFILNGKRSEALFKRITDILESAQRTLHILTPYLTFPFLETLVNVAEKGIEVTLIVPGSNNKPVIHHYLRKALRNTKVKLRVLTNQMFHLKAILIDEKSLLTGSYNFDFVGRWVQQEILVKTEDETIVSTFRAEVLDRFIDSSVGMQQDSRNPVLEYASDKALRIAQAYCRMIAATRKDD